mgnify:CR=1 FL=1
MPSLPAHLPAHMEQLIEELDQLNPAPVVTGPELDCDTCKELVFLAGRRSVVEELVRLNEKMKEGG